MRAALFASLFFLCLPAFARDCTGPANAPRDCRDWHEAWCTANDKCEGTGASQDHFQCIADNMGGLGVEEPSSCAKTLADPASVRDPITAINAPKDSPAPKTNSAPTASTKTPAGTSSPSGSNPKRDANSPSANGNIQDDIDACNSALSSGQSTCSQGQSAASQVNGSNGIYSNQAGAQNLNNAAGNCSYAAQACKNACGGAASQWQSSCSGSSCSSTVRNGIDTLNSLNGGCNNLSNQAQNMANQANQAMNDAANSMNNNNQMQPQSTPSASSAVDCTNPVARASSPDQCGVAPSPAAQAANDQSQKPGYPTDNPGTTNSNVDGTAPKQDSVFPSLNNPADNSRSNTPQMPMPMQGGIMPDSGNANQGGRASAAPGYYQKPADTNVLKGDRSGGGGSTTAGILPDEKVERRVASAGSGPGLPAGPDDLSRMRGLDLKRYLPGGDRYPGGRMGGVSRHPELYGPDVNLFQVISARFQAHCKLEPLYDCH